MNAQYFLEWFDNQLCTHIIIVSNAQTVRLSKLTLFATLHDGTESPGSMRRRSQSLFTRMKEAGYITQEVRSKCGICGG